MRVCVRVQEYTEGQSIVDQNRKIDSKGQGKQKLSVLGLAGSFGNGLTLYELCIV